MMTTSRPCWLASMLSPAQQAAQQVHGSHSTLGTLFFSLKSGAHIIVDIK